MLCCAGVEQTHNTISLLDPIQPTTHSLSLFFNSCSVISVTHNNSLSKEADSIGFPLLVKAVSGGGGKGMKIAAQQVCAVVCVCVCDTVSLLLGGFDNTVINANVID